MKICKMLETTNSRFGYKCGNIELCEFSRDKKIFWFGDLHTSYVTECKISENIMTIITRNSEYTFELLEGTEFEEFKRTSDEVNELEELCKWHNTGLDRAIALASEKFIGVYDKSGEPYILHCLQVMNNVKKWNDIELQIAAVLHDIVEDTDITFDDLEELGYSPRVIKIIKHVTKEDDVSYDDEIARICNDQDSIRVKMADLEHNSSILRLKGIRQKDLERIQKYHRAYFILQAHLKN